MTYNLNRWQGYGHDRLYVNAGSRKIGWIDLKTGRVKVTSPAGWPSPIEGMVQQWLASNGLGHLRVKLKPRKRGDEITTQEFLDRIDRSRDDDQQPAVALSIKSQRRRSNAGTDLAKNRAGSAAYAAAQERSTWWRSLGRAMGMRTEDQAWRIGAEGEQIVARTLQWARLRGWRVLHAVPVGARGSDIDHVLIGPAGVITINTKHHSGQKVRAKPEVVFVGGAAKRYGQAAQYEANRAAKLLTAAAGRPVTVLSAVVIVGAKSVRGSRSAGVEIMPKSHLLVWLLFRRRTLSRTDVDELYELARRSTTWQPS
ncbi:hypothetical protein GCM10009789_82880 [Kribbella sancticallisti]|uniref:NERD domain-containing protein n=1 Tax=Kribbella sancticallisti TaxID=460087 RepID=A0ABP4QTH2_9ACTN